MDKIILIAQQIAREGKTPNTAMIKARLPKNVPLPTIIQGLKQWQETPDKELYIGTEPTLITTAEEKKDSVDMLIETKINEMLMPLKNEIQQLKAEIKILKESK